MWGILLLVRAEEVLSRQESEEKEIREREEEKIFLKNTMISTIIFQQLHQNLQGKVTL